MPNALIVALLVGAPPPPSCAALYPPRTRLDTVLAGGVAGRTFAVVGRAGASGHYERVYVQLGARRAAVGRPALQRACAFLVIPQDNGRVRFYVWDAAAGSFLIVRAWAYGDEFPVPAPLAVLLEGRAAGA